MAAQDYYGSQSGRRQDAPLPSIPTSSTPDSKSYGGPYVGEPPIHSPFADDAHPAYPYPYQQPSQHSLHADSSYHGAGGYSEQTSTDSNPFGDYNAIPLQSQPAKTGTHDGMVHVTPDPENRLSYVAEDDSQRRKKKKKKGGWFKGKIPWVVYGLTIVQTAVFIGEIIRNSVLTGSPIAIHPSFNPMIGPSPYVLINMGARYIPCMRNQEGIQNADQKILWPCPGTTSDVAECSLSDLCGFDGVPNPTPGGSLDDEPEPNQWFRFIVPIFLHAGIVHIGFNMLLQVTLGRDIEREIGSIRFFLVYFCAGIFGFVFGGNFAPPGIAPVGASGALFGIFALTLLSLFYTWRSRRSPIKDLLFILIDIIIAFVLGLLPGFDNFSHIGGFLMGLVLGICILHSPNSLRRRTGQAQPAYGVVGRDSRDDHRPSEVGPGYRPNRETMARGEGMIGFVKDPLGFFRGRVAWWWAWWLLRAGALVAVVVVSIVLLNNFYVNRTKCEWCKYLSCIDVNGWCDIGQLQIEDQNPNKIRRDFLAAAANGINLS